MSIDDYTKLQIDIVALGLELHLNNIGVFFHDDFFSRHCFLPLNVDCRMLTDVTSTIESLQP